MTKQEKEKIEKKQKIKSIIFKILHFIGYLSTLVLILFGIGLGVSSCQNKKQEHTTSQQLNDLVKQPNYLAYEGADYLYITSDYIYNYQFWVDLIGYLQTKGATTQNNRYSVSTYLSDIIYIGYSNESSSIYHEKYYFSWSLNSTNDILTFKLYDSQSGGNSVNFMSSYNYYYDSVGSFQFMDTYDQTIYCYATASGLSLSCYSISFCGSINADFKSWLTNYTLGGGGYTEQDIEEAYSEGYEEGYEEGYGHGIEVATDPISSYYQEIYSEGYEEGYDEGFSDGLVAPTRVPTTTYLTMSNNFDWRSLFTNNIDGVTGLFYSAENLISQYNNALILEGLTFKCNDITYNQIYIPFMQLGSGLPVIVGDSQDILNLGYETVSKTTNDLYGENYDKYYALLGVYYRYYDVETETITRTDLVYNTYESKTSNNVSSTGIINVNDYRTPSWVNEYYRFLDIVDNDSTKVQTPNFGSTLTTYEIISNGGFTTLKNVNNIDPFSLMAKAFSGMASIFSIAILPGITLGVLLFLPLVVAVIITIIKLVKKG